MKTFNFIFIGIVLFKSVFAEIVSGSTSLLNQINPLVFSINPSFSSFQTGIPITFLHSYEDSAYEQYEFGATISEGYSSFCMNFKNYKNENMLTIGGSKLLNNLAIGASVTGIPSTKNRIALNIGATVNFNKWYVSTALSSINMDFENVDNLLLLSNFSGAVPYFKNLDFDCMVKTKSINEYNLLYGFQYGNLGEKFYTLRAGVEYDKKIKLKDNSLNSLLTLFKVINRISYGINFGLDYSINSQKITITSQILFNPLYRRDTKPPILSVAIFKDTLNPELLLLSIISKDEKLGSGIKNWSLILSKQPTVEKGVLKIFSGGDVPPSTLLWDYHDTEGYFYNEEEIFYRCIITDNAGNVSKTAWKKHKL